MAKLDVSIREATRDEHAHVYVTWIKSFADSPFAKGMRPSVYEDRQRKLINEILARSGARILVACTPGADAVLGWAVVEEPGTLHYVFVKEHFRRLGIASALVDAAPKGFRYTHRTFGAIPFLRRIAGVLYDPYAAFGRAA